MTKAEKALQKALGTALYPLGIVVLRGEMQPAACGEHALVFDVKETHSAWANDRPILSEVDVELRYYARSAPLEPEHLARIHEVMRGLGYREDGAPADTPRVNATDYVGKSMTYRGMRAADGDPLS